MKDLLKIIGVADADVLTESTFFEEQYYDSGIPALNLAFSGKLDGGFTNGITTLAGESKTGKTLFMHLCASQYLKNHKGHKYIFFDCEHGSNNDTFESVGMDRSRVIHVPVNNIEQLKTAVMRLLASDHEDIIIGVDSFGEIASIKEVEDSIDGKTVADMTRAKQLNSYFRMVKPLLNTKKIPHIGIGKTYDEIKMYGGKVLGGGQGITKQSDSILFITKSQIKEGADLVGASFNITVNKGRLVKEKSKVSIHIYDDERGLYRYSSMFDIGLDIGMIIKETAQTYSIPVLGETGRRKALDVDEYMSKLVKNDEFKEAVEGKFKFDALTADLDEEDED